MLPRQGQYCLAIGMSRPGLLGSSRLELLHIPSGERIWTWLTDPGHFVGGVVSMPDIDGDGYSDIAVGTPSVPFDIFFNRDAGAAIATLAGAVTLLSGQCGTVLCSRSASRGESAYGFAIIGVPDYDNDGIRDLAIGSPRLEADGVASVHVLSGATLGTIRIIPSPRIATEVGPISEWLSAGVFRARHKHSFGTSLAFFAWPGKREAYLAIGSPLHSPNGLTHAGSLDLVEYPECSYARTLDGYSRRDYYGISIGPALYLNHVPSFLLPAWHRRLDLVTLPAMNVQALHEVAGRTGFGHSILGVPDVNADGVPEVVVSDCELRHDADSYSVRLIDGLSGEQLSGLSTGHDQVVVCGPTSIPDPLGPLVMCVAPYAGRALLIRVTPIEMELLAMFDISVK